MISLSVLALTALTTMVTLAAAQIDPAVTVAAQPNELQLGPGGQATIAWTVRNTGPVDGDVTVASTAPSGWAVELAQADLGFRLAAGAQRTLTANVRAPDAALNVTPADGPWELSATLTDDIGRSDQAAGIVSLTYVHPPAPVQPPARDDTSLFVAIGAAAAVLILIASYVWQGRRVEVALEKNDLDVPLGSYAIVHAQVHNLSRWARNVHVRVARLPSKWGGAFSARFVRVPGRGTERVPLFLRLPFDDRPDVVRILPIQARPNRYSPWVRRAQLRIHAADVRVPMLVRTASPLKRNGDARGAGPDAVVPKARA